MKWIVVNVRAAHIYEDNVGYDVVALEIGRHNGLWLSNGVLIVYICDVKLIFSPQFILRVSSNTDLKASMRRLVFVANVPQIPLF